MTLSGEAGVYLANSFRNAMRRQASTVAILTAIHGDEMAGMTATAVMPVSAEPPSVAVGVNLSSSIHRLISDSGVFGVNFLRCGHEALVARFSGQVKGASRFAAGDWRAGARQVPILNDALVSMICLTAKSVDFGTHTIFIGEIIELDLVESIDPLMWINGRFAGQP
jgi:flavin reductase